LVATACELLSKVKKCPGAEEALLIRPSLYPIMIEVEHKGALIVIKLQYFSFIILFYAVTVIFSELV
jgi:hypothetical protein